MSTDQFAVHDVATQHHAKVAYTVSSDDEDLAVVVFVHSEAEARLLGANELDLRLEHVDSCVRTPAFDGYADTGKVPPLVAIAHGWWFECNYCGHKIDQDAEGPDGEELHPVADGQRVYCNEAHLMAAWQERRAREARENAAIEACALKFFGWPIVNLRGTEHYAAHGSDPVACCDFDFMGRKGLHARWDLGAKDVCISECDRDAWNSIRESVKAQS